MISMPKTRVEWGYAALTVVSLVVILGAVCWQIHAHYVCGLARCPLGFAPVRIQGVCGCLMAPLQ